ncbi:hypothetical protein DL89DRAFT_266527, partial [Linderina pennispora]
MEMGGAKQVFSYGMSESIAKSGVLFLCSCGLLPVFPKPEGIRSLFWLAGCLLTQNPAIFARFLL